MFKKLFGITDKETARVLSDVSELQIGDIISLKHRNELPKPLQGTDLEVTDVNTYQYESYTTTEFTVKSSENAVYFLSKENDDGEESLCFSIKVKRSDVTSLFDEDRFSLLWDEDQFPELVVKPIEHLSSWSANCYYQQIKSAQGYYYGRDCRGETLSRDMDDDGEEFQYHECEGDDNRFGLSVEVVENGTTDVFLHIYTLIDVVEQFHPHD